MGYHPTAWRTRKLEDLCISREVLEEFGFKVMLDMGINRVELTSPDWVGCSVIEVAGMVYEGEFVRIAEFFPQEIYQDDYYKMEELLGKSLGFIEYVITWENGDSVSIVSFQNGKKTEEVII